MSMNVLYEYVAKYGWCFCWCGPFVLLGAKLEFCDFASFFPLEYRFEKCD